MSKTNEKADELKKDAIELAKAAGEELQDAATDLTKEDEKKPNKVVDCLKKYGIPALAFGLGWGAKTLKIMLTNQAATNIVDAGNVVEMPVVNTDTTAV